MSEEDSVVEEIIIVEEESPRSRRDRLLGRVSEPGDEEDEFDIPEDLPKLDW